jgi:iron complex transport system permease protein
VSGLASILSGARAPVALSILSGICVVLALSGVAFGSTWIPLEQVASVILGAGEKTQKLIVLQLRLPRVVIATLAGGGMAVAGFLLQKITRNALASPGVLGVIDGAALGVVIFLAALSNESNALVTSIAYQPLAAMAGAVLGIALVFLLSGQQSASAVRLLLFGIAVAAVFKGTSQAARWIAGAVNEINWSEIQITLLMLLPLLLLAMLAARKMPPADLDEVSARGVGLDLPVFRMLIFALAAGLTAVSVAFVGGVGFIGLMAPHLARLVVGRNIYAGLLGSFLLGAIMLIGADLIVRVLFSPVEVPAGTVTAVIGAPYFLFLLMSRQRHDG